MKIAFIPYNPNLLDNELFSCDKYDLSNVYGPDRPAFYELRQRLTNKGHVVGTIDDFELTNVDVCIMVDINYHYLERIRGFDDPPKTIYLMREPPTFVPFNSAARILRYMILFDKVITWDPTIATAHAKCTEYRLPYYHPEMNHDGRSFGERKLLCNISGRKYSTHPDELYSTREDVIQYFDRHHPDQFSHYGVGWDSSPNLFEPLTPGQFRPTNYRTYRGIVDSKEGPFGRHRFALCLENIASTKGYVSEKLFDCLRFGVVPVYWGASDIEEYVPEGAFIDYSDYPSPEMLYERLVEITSKEYRDYRNTARQFLTESGERFTADRFAQTMSEHILSTDATSANGIPVHLSEEISTLSKYDYLRYNHDDVRTAEYLVEMVRLFRKSPRMIFQRPKLYYNLKEKVFPKGILRSQIGDGRDLAARGSSKGSQDESNGSNR